MTILNTFANQSGRIPLSQLDSNFATPITIGTTPIILGDIATTITGLTLADADLGSPTGNLVNCTFPTLNQNTTGTASNVTGLVLVGNGGTGVTTSTGSGSNVLSTSPTLITPNLGTPSTLVGTNITGTATNFTATTVSTIPNLSGAVSSSGSNVTSLGSFTSANLATALTDKTGSGANVFANSPTLVTPALGTPSTGNLANCSFPTLNQNTTGTASNVTGVVAVGNGGTGVTTSTGTGNTVLSASPTFTGTLNSANLAYTGALTGGTGIVAIGTNQIYKDASGNVGIGTSSPTAVLQIASNATGTDFRSLSTKAGIALNFTGSGISYYDSDTTIFRTSTGSGSTERMRIDSAGNVTLQNNISVGGAAPTTVGTGITFPATQAASSNANTLDDYEEGTWVPTYVNFTITSGTSEARYTKVGRVITANIWINATSVSCLANATFTLPIAAVSYSAGSAVSSNVVSGIQITGSTTGTVREAITTTANLALTVTYQLAS